MGNLFNFFVKQKKKGGGEIMVFNATFNIISVTSGSRLYWWRKQEDPDKTTDLLQVTNIEANYRTRLALETCKNILYGNI
jgi:hypothetical protein